MFPNVSCEASADAGGIGHVTDDAPGIRSGITQAFDRRCQHVRLDIGKHDFHARLREGAAEREPYAARPTRHKGCFAGKFAHDCSWWPSMTADPCCLLLA
jgi:hypothetical protein